MDMPLASGLWSEASSGCIKHDGLLWVTSPLGSSLPKSSMAPVGGGVYVLQKAVTHRYSHCALTPWSSDA